MRKKFIAIILLMLVLLAACNGKSANEELESKDNEPTDIKELVYNYSVGKIKNQSASITSKQLIVTDSDDKELVYDLPEEEFFVSIAPFINETHPCENHSLTGCQGELVNQDFDLYIEDMDGNVVLDETMNSESNGFIDLWLPRDKTYNVNISHEGKRVESEISTFEKDGTCITTMQLT
ncbi:CueP family metal-binding protein [Pseudogracilibacillus auburnensis]|uniref:Secreted protein n=1 Tax=Pseudogracilibacillus auburnensis TaxID=1494959 RepID=A0A2V3W815_9BACI|nr:CueP family metal-binding protein [Pseudogracilibacillus auburnensis]PXW90487.1 hypothetical protein DFR56_101399 [Pseudogracilibacillus auburnensis]